jgi:hypothetical protein
MTDKSQEKMAWPAVFLMAIVVIGAAVFVLGMNYLAAGGACHG